MHTPIDSGYPILPRHIDVARGFKGGFGGFDRRIEKAAEIVIGFFASEREDFCGSFTNEDIQLYYNKIRLRAGKTVKDFSFIERLRGGGFLNIQGKEIFVTHELVARCFLASKYHNGAPQERKSST